MLIAMDDDKAGWKATRDIAAMLEQENMDWSVFDYATDCKDANENLQHHRKDFEKTYYQLSAHTIDKEKGLGLEQEIS